MLKKLTAVCVAAIFVTSLVACNNTETASMETAQSSTNSKAESSTTNVTVESAIDASDLFTDRDMEQTADTSKAKSYTVSDGKNIDITSAGVYVISGAAKNMTVTVDAADDDKVQLVLDGVSITNTDFPAIYVKNADKVFVTTSGENTLSVTDSFTADGDTNTDAVIFSKDDLVLNGTGSLTIHSTNNGISGKDDLKITGGTIIIDCPKDALEANDSIAIADGTITITTQKDGLHAENDDNDAKGYIYICGGTLNITADDDGIHATTIAQIDGGNFTISAAEGIEATWVQINDGTINISASDDGINGASKSSKYSVVVEINGGDITINMGQGDTDGIDSNGDLYINGGMIDVTCQSPFDYDGKAEKNGGTIIVNGEETDEITNQFMGGPGMGGMHGGGRMPNGGMKGDMPNGDMKGGMWGGKKPNDGMKGDMPGGDIDGSMPQPPNASDGTFPQ